MTDDEIIKSLKCCSHNDTGGCRQCACRINTAACIPILMREATSLILRQKAKIEMFEDKQALDKNNCFDN